MRAVLRFTRMQLEPKLRQPLSKLFKRPLGVVSTVETQHEVYAGHTRAVSQMT